MNKYVGKIWLFLLILVAVESISAYVLFRYYSFIDKEIRPEGSATWMLVDGSINKALGKHPQTIVSVDHGPLFTADDVLGFTLVPGRYRVGGRLHRERHSFDISVTDRGNRATAYFPIHSSKRIFMTGDSAMFGWGLDDEETMPWLLQSRLPNYEVLNLSLTSYSMLQTYLQLLKMEPKVGPDDVIEIVYDRLATKLNVAPADVLLTLTKGYETQLGNPERMRNLQLPYGVINARGEMSIKRVSVTCAHDTTSPACVRPGYQPEAAIEVTERVLDKIIDLHPKHVVIVFLTGVDNDPVIAYLRLHGAIIADLRDIGNLPVDFDLVPADSHMGPFWHHQQYKRLLEVMLANDVVDLP